MRRFVGVTSALLALALTGTAQAAPGLEAQVATPAVRYGAAHTLTGTLTDGATPLANQPVVLEGQRYPYEDGFHELERATTGADGTFTFKPELDRNHVLRIVAPAQSATSPALRVYVLPSFELSFRAIRPGVVRLYQRYTVPSAVKLAAPTLFYLGRNGATTATKRVAADTKVTARGRYTAIATVRLPRAWHGRFRYGSCFRTSLGSGMGEPDATCPKVSLKF